MMIVFVVKKLLSFKFILERISILFIFIFSNGIVLSQSHQIGQLTTTFTDASRNNRQVPVAIYYPADAAGTAVPVASGVFPVISFGHGFVMVHTSYQYLWEALVPLGYIVAFPLTEGSAIPPPNHLEFGLDIAFVAKKVMEEGQNPTSLFFNHVMQRSALMGHSMGGGAAFIGAASDTGFTTLITLAAANTSPSAVHASTFLSLPVLQFAGEKDCITPPSMHQQPIYDSTASPLKSMITVLGGGHCYFADYNFNCALGELTCSPQPTITRQAQQDVTLDFLKLWLDYTLYNQANAWQIFYDSLLTSSRITYQLQIPSTGLVDSDSGKCQRKIILVTDDWEVDRFIQTSEPASIRIYSMSGKIIFSDTFLPSKPLIINTKVWKRGWYIVNVVTNNEFCRMKILRR